MLMLLKVIVGCRNSGANSGANPDPNVEPVAPDGEVSRLMLMLPKVIVGCKISGATSNPGAGAIVLVTHCIAT